MKYIIDTCVLSEIVRPVPNQDVLRVIADLPPKSLYLSAITIGELKKGICKLDDGARRSHLQRWLNETIEKFEGYMLPVTWEIANLWGKITATSSRYGFAVSFADGLIGATTNYHNAVLITRNTKDFDPMGVSTINPYV